MHRPAVLYGAGRSNSLVVRSHSNLARSECFTKATPVFGECGRAAMNLAELQLVTSPDKQRIFLRISFGIWKNWLGGVCHFRGNEVHGEFENRSASDPTPSLLAHIPNPKKCVPLGRELTLEQNFSVGSNIPTQAKSQLHRSRRSPDNTNNLAHGVLYKTQP